MLPRVSWPIWGACYLTLQSILASSWWIILWLEPRSRHFFRPAGTPDSALLSFFLPDAVLFISAALWAAFCLLKKPKSTVIPLALHTGAAAYGALYCLMQWILTGDAILAALFMAPCLFVGPLLLWKLTRD